MRQSISAGVLVWSIALVPLAGPAFAAPCQKGVASAPYIGGADMQAIARAAETLPKAGRATADVGSTVSISVKRALVPRPVAKVLPQYEGYSAFKAGDDLVIVDARGIVSYVMPLRGTASPANCP